MDEITLKYQELDGKRIAYHSKSVFQIQIGKNKSAYHTVASFEGNLTQAVLNYNGYNIGNGYKKRLVCWSFNKPILARAFS